MLKQPAFDVREATLSVVRGSREANAALCRITVWKKQKPFAMLAVRLSDMPWLLQFLSSFLVVLVVRGNENGTLQTFGDLRVKIRSW